MGTNRKKAKFNRYHCEVYFPENFPQMVLEFINTFKGDVDLTTHAAEQMYEDKRGQIPLPTNDELLNPGNKIIEIYERLDKPGRIQKAVFRIGHLNENYDYSYVVARDGVIVTAWTNDKGDNHRLTNALNEYIQPPNRRI